MMFSFYFGDILNDVAFFWKHTHETGFFFYKMLFVSFYKEKQILIIMCDVSVRYQ